MAQLSRISNGQISLRTLFAVVIALLAGAVACSKSSTREASSSTNAKEASSETKAALPPVDLKGPIVAVTIASSIDDKGQPVNPRFTFPPDERQLTVFVQVGEITGSPLDITWTKTSDDGDQKLFEHTVEVKTWDRAFSIGKNPGRLAPGSYKAAVTLEGHKREVEFDVVAAKGNSPLANRSEAVQGAPPISGGSGTVPRPPAPAGAAKDRYPWQEDRPDLKKCELTLEPFDQDSPIVRVLAANMCESDFGPVRVEAKISGKSSLLSTEKGQHVYSVDPCSLDHGSDLPGTNVKFWAAAVDDPSLTAQKGITLGDDTLAPRVHTVSSIKRDTKVKAGDRITLDVTAQEKRSGGPWQTGVKIIQVTAEPGGLVGNPWTNPSTLPKPCDQKTWSQPYKATYTVPKNPPPIIKICSIAEDYQGNESSQCGEFPTGDKLKGKLSSTTTIKAGTGVGKEILFTYQTDADLSLTLQDDGTVTGMADVTYSAHGEGWTLCLKGAHEAYTFIMNPNPVYKAKVTGTVTPSGIEFRLTGDSPLKASITETWCHGKKTRNHVEDHTTLALGIRWKVKPDGKAYTWQEQVLGQRGGSTSWTIRLEPQE